jgi:hypothetical protein
VEATSILTQGAVARNAAKKGSNFIDPTEFCAHSLREHWSSLPRSTAWYLKSQASFSDLLALVRRTIWAEANYVKSTPGGEQVIISGD